MNVIVSNKQKEIIDNANIDAIKDLNGLFSVDDLVNKFKNYFFSKMILDATSVANFATREVLEKLSSEIGSDRLIILLPSTPEPPEEFKKLLIDLKIYNFSNNIDDIVKFIEKPNTYDNVMNTIMNSHTDGSDYYVDNSIKDGEGKEFDNVSDTTNNDTSLDNENITNNYSNNYIVNNNRASLGDAMSRLDIYGDDSDTSDDIDDNVQNIEEETINNEEDSIQKENEVFNYNLDTVDMDTHDEDYVPNSDSYVFLNMDGFDNIEEDKPKSKLVIGFKNVTEHAGSSTLIYLLEKEANKRNKDVISIEINKDDFKLFRDKRMISVKEKDLFNTLNSLRESVVLIDLNDCTDDSFCNELVYLVEPSIIKLNKLMMVNKNVFTDLKDKKVILNKSVLSRDDIHILEREANMTFFFSINSLNDRIDNPVISELFDRLIN